jgi:hypothetical protein
MTQTKNADMLIAIVWSKLMKSIAVNIVDPRQERVEVRLW